MRKKIWLVVEGVLKGVVGVATVLTVLILCVHLLPEILKMNVVKANNWMPSVFILTGLFWVVYLTKKLIDEG